MSLIVDQSKFLREIKDLQRQVRELSASMAATLTGPVATLQQQQEDLSAAQTTLQGAVADIQQQQTVFESFQTHAATNISDTELTPNIGVVVGSVEFTLAQQSPVVITSVVEFTTNSQSSSSSNLGTLNGTATLMLDGTDWLTDSIAGAGSTLVLPSKVLPTSGGNPQPNLQCVCAITDKMSAGTHTVYLEVSASLFGATSSNLLSANNMALTVQTVPDKYPWE